MSPLRTDVTEADVQDWCCAYLARTLRLRAEKIDRMATFASIGLDSADSLFLVSALEDWSGLVLDSETAYEHPSVAALARFVIGRIEAASARE